MQLSLLCSLEHSLAGLPALATRPCLPARSLLMDAPSSSSSLSLDSSFDAGEIEAAEGGEIKFLSVVSGSVSTSSGLSSPVSSVAPSGRLATFPRMCLPFTLFQFGSHIMLFLGPMRCEVCSESIGLLFRHDGIWQLYCLDCFLVLRQSRNYLVFFCSGDVESHDESSDLMTGWRGMVGDCNSDAMSEKRCSVKDGGPKAKRPFSASLCFLIDADALRLLCWIDNP